MSDRPREGVGQIGHKGKRSFASRRRVFLDRNINFLQAIYRRSEGCRSRGFVKFFILTGKFFEGAL
ncbi:hypothetical protein HB4184_08710 [Pseudomonas putida]|nr:hypothetical protein HB4184_08710 [Pseudomonas putida]